MNSKNVKDTLSTIIGIIGAIAGAILTAQEGGLILPSWVAPACKAIVTISTLAFGILMGKNPDGSTKTPEQAAVLNDPKPISNPIVTPETK